MEIFRFAEFYNSFDVNKYIENNAEEIYHYTSAIGLSSILKNSTLRFTDRLYLNDMSEGIYVLKLCLENMDSFDFLTPNFKKALSECCQKRLDNPQRDRFFVYQCSFSLDKDSLCLWNYYTKSDGIKGYNIKFKVKDIEDTLAPKRIYKDAPKLRYGKVIYDKKMQINIIKEIVEIFYKFSKENENRYINFIVPYLVDN